MTGHPSPTRARTEGLRHEAYLWRTPEEFLARAVPFIADGVRAGETVVAALVPARWGPVRQALGALAEHVHHVDIGTLGRNPARLIPAWQEYVDRHGGDDRPMRGIGEPIWPGRREPEVVECQIHEALLNVAFPARTPLWLLCPYDAAALSPEVIEEVGRSHPAVTGAPTGSPAGFGGHDHLRDLCERTLPALGATRRTLAFGPGDLARVRAMVAAAAADALVPRPRVDDLAMAVNELAANSIDHGGGTGVLRLWVEGGALVCEVEDAGRITDPLVGRRRPTGDQPRGRGVWMVHQLCDLVQIRPTPTGTVVRVHTWL